MLQLLCFWEFTMHLVTRSYFDNFCENFGAPFEESKNFEAFTAYCAFTRYSADNIEAADLVYDGADPGIDGALIFLDDRAVFSAEELEEIFKSSRREFHVTVVLTQAMLCHMVEARDRLICCGNH